jgi:hypothetical protein
VGPQQQEKHKASEHTVEEIHVDAVPHNYSYGKQRIKSEGEKSNGLREEGEEGEKKVRHR